MKICAKSTAADCAICGRTRIKKLRSLERRVAAQKYLSGSIMDGFGVRNSLLTSLGSTNVMLQVMFGVVLLPIRREHVFHRNSTVVLYVGDWRDEEAFGIPPWQSGTMGTL